MAERPLLPIPRAKRSLRVKNSISRFTPNANIARPGFGRQSERLGPKFDRLRQVGGHSSAQIELALRRDPDAIAPERAIVFEVAGSLPDFYNLAARIPGLAFLLLNEIIIEPDKDFHTTKNSRGEKIISESDFDGCLYMAMPDLRALQEILRLWDRYRKNQELGFGFSSWSTLFGLLRGVRGWGPKDRVLPETQKYWRDQLATKPDQPVRLEIELWFHERTDRRQQALATVSAQIDQMGGQLISTAIITSIRYHGLLIDLPADRITELLANPAVTLGRLDDIMYLRPQSVASFPTPANITPDVENTLDENNASVIGVEPIAALLDGVPVANHQRLVGRIILDDPNDCSANSPADKRSHGTSMASLIVHGDLQAGEPPLTSPIYVLPVMIYSQQAECEMVPPDRLPIDYIYLAIRGMLEGNGNDPPSAPSVVVINLSLGDPNRPFAGRISPWARLLDWLAFRYRVLFLVSVGNVPGWLPISAYASRQEFLNADPDNREIAILAAMNSEKARRSLLSPAEGLNAIAVGACHADAYENPSKSINLTDPFSSVGLPNISSAVGLGYKRSIKPDLLYDGGRELVLASEDEGHVWLRADSGGHYAGQLSAAPDFSATGRLDAVQRTVGSSNATALLTRSAIRIYHSLAEAGHSIPQSHSAVLLKALLVHGAKWGDAGNRLQTFFGPPGHAHLAQRDDIARFLGYGRPDVQRVLDCVAERATLFGYGDLARDMQDEFDIPIPPSLEGSTQNRRLTITLAWLTPINVRHQQYRSATLELLPNGDTSYSLSVERVKDQPNFHAVDRGTTFHSVFEGESAVAFLDGGALRLRVVCRAQAGVLDEMIPYAIAISIETALGSGIAVYDEVRAAIQPTVRATPVPQ